MNLFKLVFIIASMVAVPAYAQAGLFAFSQFNSSNRLTVNNGIEISNAQSGWVRYDGWHESWNPGYYVDYCNQNCVPSLNNWFSFDISGLGSTEISGASFTVFSYTVFQPSQYTLFDYAQPIESLTTPELFVQEGVYSDLGSGNSYGSADVTTSNTFVTIALSANGVADLRAAVASGQQFFIIGGTTAPVPEPSKTAMFALGLGAVVLFRRRRMKAPRYAARRDA